VTSKAATPKPATAACWEQDLYKIEFNVKAACKGSLAYSSVDGVQKPPFHQLKPYSVIKVSNRSQVHSLRLVAHDPQHHCQLPIRHLHQRMCTSPLVPTCLLSSACLAEHILVPMSAQVTNINKNAATAAGTQVCLYLRNQCTTLTQLCTGGTGSCTAALFSTPVSNNYKCCPLSISTDPLRRGL
jgi:hypothetical protein